ncbi:MAG TPA: MarR family transcriptional regulator [Stellaceae bacterium]|nr:MarR family transcriptional regulator [Stellaceae bacterium]
MFELRNTLPFLLNRTGIRMAELFGERDLARFGVTLSMYRVLAVLHRQDDVRLGELAALADMEVSTLSRLIGSMQTKRLVSRRRSGKDARAVRIRATDQGRALAQKLIAAVANYEDSVTASLGVRQVQELKRMLAQIADTITAIKSGQDQGRTRARRQSAA